MSELVVYKAKNRISRTTAIAVGFAGLVFGISTTRLILWYINYPDVSNLGVTTLVMVATAIISLQGILTLMWMLYAWNNPEEADKYKSPDFYSQPNKSFTVLIPAKNESLVIGDTIRAADAINYPEELKETIVICRFDDDETIEAARSTIQRINKNNVRLLIYYDQPVNKSHSLNIGLENTRNDVVAVFDAEDQPHQEIFNIVNTLMVREKADVVQSGVQLINYRSNWFSALNCLEYFFWFKSGLHFFSRIGKSTPLGGNTVFFNRKYLHAVTGWDEKCLTEDADIGFRLVEAGANIRIVYDERHTTQEETPPNLKQFITQRTRWNQGFLQILTKGTWLRLPKLRQKLTALYIISAPIMMGLTLLYWPIAVWVALNVKIPIVYTLITVLPFIILGLQLTTLSVGLYEFTRAYKLKYPWFAPLIVIVTYFPYQFLLTAAAFRAIFRLIFQHNSWEKTLHVNAHRSNNAVIYAR